jgi:uncharacterized membrane protein YccF (DUF307 family)
MQIKIPLRLARWADSFADILNVVLIRRGRLTVRVVDVAVGIIGTVSTVWWYAASGWWGALESVLMFALAMMMAVWFF